MEIIYLLSSSRRLSVFIFYFIFQFIIRRVPFAQQTKDYLISGYGREIPDMLCTYAAGICTQACTGAGTGIGTSIPVPDTSISSVRHQYRYRTLRKVRYDINTGTGHFGKFGTPIPVPDTSASSV